MKKPMKFKRYEGGGEISGTVDPKEAADKEAGLKASKDEDVGFFKRLRMGNIDDPNSEAYKRFGAGRGRSERTPVDESVSVNEPMAVARPTAQPNPIFEESRKQGMRQPSGDASVAEEYAKRPRNPEAEQEADNPRKTVFKPTGKREVGESVSGTPTVRNKVTAPSLGNDDYGSSTSKESAPSAVKQKPAAEAPTKTSSSRVPTSEQASANRAAAAEKVKGMGSSVADYFSTYETPAERKAKERKEKAAKGSYASGGSVNSASRRADGIATKGKTRGRMC